MDMKISLKEEMQTLLIPLYGRAMMSKKGVFKDYDAELAVTQIDYDFSRLHIQAKTQIMLSIRGALIDDFTKEYLREHSDSTVIYLGCGLDSRARRLGFPAKLWYDLDFPEVIHIKKQLYQETKNYKYISSSVTDWNWLDSVECNNSPVLVIAEGLLMYLCEPDIKRLFLTMRDRFPDTTLIFDAYSCLTAKQAKHHPSLKKTGATLQWGVDSPQALESFGMGITHLKTMYLTDDSATEPLPKGYRIMFRLMGRFKAVQEAHRIFVMKLVRVPM
jgi:O-methyltransferase involved in polyketide biosynthesis